MEKDIRDKIIANAREYLSHTTTDICEVCLKEVTLNKNGTVSVSAPFGGELIKNLDSPFPQSCKREGKVKEGCLARDLLKE